MATRNENEVNADVIEGTNHAFKGAWLWDFWGDRLLWDFWGDRLLRFTPLLSGNWLEI